MCVKKNKQQRFLLTLLAQRVLYGMLKIKLVVQRIGILYSWNIKLGMQAGTFSAHNVYQHRSTAVIRLKSKFVIAVMMKPQYNISAEFQWSLIVY